MRTTIYRKMIAGFFLIIVAMIVLDAYLLNELRRVTDSVHTTLGINVASVVRARDLRRLLDEQEGSAQKFLVSRDSTYFSLFTEAARNLANGLDSLGLVLGSSVPPGVMERFRAINDSVVAALSVPARSFPGVPAFNRSPVEVSDSIEVMRRLLNDIIQQNQASIVSRVVADDRRSAEALQVAVLLTAGSIAITVFLAFVLARTITNPIRVLQAGAARVASGAFQAIPLTSRDELADLTLAFNEMGENLRRANEHRAEMLQRIVHELRTPLQSLHSVYYLLSEQVAGPLNEQQRRYVEMLRVNAERITDFTNQFLDLAKIEAGRMQFQRQPTDLQALAEKAVEGIRLLAESHRISVNLRPERVREVDVDPEKMTQVVNNLLSNAVKFTPDGGAIEVRLEEGEGCVRMLVSDSGTGIDPEDLPHLFTKFYQAKNAPRARTRGTGIGLALVRAIVNGHGGKMHVRSEVGRGSTFCVELPAGEPAAQDNVGG